MREREYKTIILVTSLLLSLSSLFFFSKDFINSPKTGFISTTIWLASILVWSLFPLVSKVKGHKVDKTSLFTRNEKFIFLSILIFSMAIRLYKIEHLGVFLDDWYWLDHARGILDAKITTPFGFIGDQPSNLPSYFVAIFYLLLGKTYLAARLTGIFFSLLNIIFTFLLTKELFGKRIALVTVFLIGTSIWDIYVAKIPWINTTINPFLITSSAYFFYRSIKYHSLKDIFWSGIFVGLSVNLVYLAAIHAFGLTIFAILKFITSPNKKKLLRTFSLLVFSVFLVSSPTLLKIKNYPQATLGRHKAFAEKSLIKSTGIANYYFAELKTTLKSFRSRPDNYQRHTFPYWGITIELIVQYLFWIGLLYSIIKIKDDRFQLLLISFFVMFIPLVIFERGVSEWREYGFFSHIYIFSSLGITAIIESAVTPGWFKKKTGFLIFLILFVYTISLIFNFKKFQKYNLATNPFEYEAQCQEIAEFILKNVPTDKIILLPDEICKEMVAVRIWDHYKYQAYRGLDDLSLFISSGKSYAIIILSHPYRYTNTKVPGERELDKFLVNYDYQKIELPKKKSLIYLPVNKR